MENIHCKHHPGFDPRSQSPTPGCATCKNLYHGLQCVGTFSGEYNASEQDIAKAKIKLGPMNFEQFGQVRLLLEFDFNRKIGPSFYVDKKTMMIFPNSKLTEDRIEFLKKSVKCDISSNV